MTRQKILLITPDSATLDKGLPPNSLASKLSQIYEKREKEKLEKVGLKLKEPPCYSYQTSRGLLCIATFLEKENFNVKYLQMDYEKDKRPNKTDIDILRENLDEVTIIGLTSYTHNFTIATKIAQIIKNFNPKITVVIGGDHASALQKEVIKDPNIDIVVSGEGEKPFLEISKTLTSTQQHSLKNIPGISYKELGEIKHNEGRYPALEGTDIPTPAYHLIGSLPGATFVLETARGCPNKCLFCAESAFWGPVRYRDLNEVANEIEIIKAKGYNTVHICDPIFPINKERIRLFVNKLPREKTGMNFNCNIRVEPLDKEMLELLSNLGVYSLFLGMESCSNKVLEIMNKKITFERYYEKLKEIKSYRTKGLPLISASWMIGHPGETKDTFKLSLRRMKELLTEGLIDEVWPKIFVPYPGTELFKNPQKYGLKIENQNWERYLRQNHTPIYRLENFSEMDIYAAYEEAMRDIIKILNH